MITRRMLRIRPAAIIFDMDGLLFDTERISRASMIEVASAMGYPMTEAIFATLIGIPEDGNRARLASVFGAAFDYDLMRARQQALNTERYGLARPLRPGARAIVEAVAALGIPCGVATSSSRAKAQSYLSHSDLLGVMQVILTRDDVARGKPFPDLYLAACAGLAQPPAACLAIEDSPVGVRAAHAAGVPVIMVPDLLPATPEIAEMALAVADDLDMARGWLLATAA
jgi:HAD superfamily hydrolase (TIGR01509 family)